MTSYIAALVVDHAVTKLDALGAIARVLDVAVEGAGTEHPRIPLDHNVWAEIDIPKFGEPPPLTIDVHSAESIGHARREALALMRALTAGTPWNVRPHFPLSD